MGEHEKNPLLPEWVEPSEGEEQTRYRVRGLSGLDALELLPEIGMSDDGRSYSVTGKGLRLALLRGVVEWETEEGRQVAFNPARADEIPPIKMRQLAMVIVYKTQFTEGQRKNS